MKRDMDLVRSLLLVIEASEDPKFPKVLTATHEASLNGYAADQIHEHLVLMAGGNLISRGFAPDGSSSHQFLRVAWAGYEFLEGVRDPEIWKKTKAGAAKVGAISFTLMLELAAGYAKAKAQALGLPMM